MKNNFIIADVRFEIEYSFPETLAVMKDYLTEQPAEVKISVAISEAREEQKAQPNAPLWYFESIVIARKINDVLVSDYSGFLFHASSVEYNGKGYAFTAHSGVGKSTHTKILTDCFPQIKHVNDDKPIIRYFERENKFYIYGNPWRGKHGRGANSKAELRAICFIYRNAENVLSTASSKKVFPLFLEQIVYPENEGIADKLLTLVDKLFSSVKLYSLGCNLSKEAGETSFNGILNEKN